MKDQVMSLEIGLRTDPKAKYTGPDYTLEQNSMSIGGSNFGSDGKENTISSIDGKNLCGTPTPNSTKVAGKGESLGMNTQKPMMNKMVTGEMGTVSMETEKAMGRVVSQTPYDLDEEDQKRVDEEEEKRAGKLRVEAADRNQRMKR